MAAIYEEIEIAWKGKTYAIKPTYRLIQRVEQKLSIAALMKRLLDGEVPFSQVADLLFVVLSAAGCRDVTEEELWEAMWGGDQNNEFLTMGWNVLRNFMPTPKEKPGNAEAPKKEGGHSQTTSIGENTILSPSDSLGSSPASSGG